MGAAFTKSASDCEIHLGVRRNSVRPWLSKRLRPNRFPVGDSALETELHPATPIQVDIENDEIGLRTPRKAGLDAQDPLGWDRVIEDIWLRV
jgi:hypothetical protein